MIKFYRFILFSVFLLVPLMFFPIFVEQFEFPKLALMWLALSLLVAVIPRRIPKADPIAIGLLALLGSSAVSGIWSIDQKMSLFGNPVSPNGFLTLLVYVGFYYVTRALVPTSYTIPTIDPDRLKKWILAPAIVVCAYALSQFFGDDPIKWGGQLIEYGVLRPNSTMGHPNFLGAYLVSCLLITLSLYDKRAKIALTCLFGAVIVLTQSRGTWLALAASLAVYAWFMHRITLKKVLISIGALLLVPPLGGVLANKVITAQHWPLLWNVTSRLGALFSFKGARAEYMLGALRVWKKYPWLGSGTDTFQLSFEHQRSAAYWAMEPGGAPHRAHNEILNLLATQGLLGLVALIFLTVACVAMCAQLRRGSKYHGLLVALLVAFAVQSISSLTVATTGFFVVVTLALIANEITPALKPARVGITRILISFGLLIMVGLSIYRYGLSSYYAHQSVMLRGQQPEMAFAYAAKADFTEKQTEEYKVLLAQTAEAMFLKTKEPKYLGVALQSFAEAVLLNPAQALNHYFLGIAFTQVGKLDLAKLQFDVAMGLEPNNPIYARRGQ